MNNTKIKDINIIAEIGWNHMGDMKLAKQMIESAAKNGDGLERERPAQRLDRCSIDGRWRSTGCFSSSPIGQTSLYERMGL